MNLVAGEKPEEGFLETLHWDRQDLLHEMQGWWALQRDVMGKGANGGQSCVAAALASWRLEDQWVTAARLTNGSAMIRRINAVGFGVVVISTRGAAPSRNPITRLSHTASPPGHFASSSHQAT